MNQDIEEGIWWKLCFAALNYEAFDEPFLPLRCALAHHLFGFKPGDQWFGPNGKAGAEDVNVNTSALNRRWRFLSLCLHPDKHADASPEKASRMQELFQLAGCCKAILEATLE